MGCSLDSLPGLFRSYLRVFWCILEIPMALVKISITLKPTLLDAQGRVVENALHALGYAEVEQVRIGKYMEVSLPSGPDIEARVGEMCERLLANPVIEEYRFEVVGS